MRPNVGFFRVLGYAQLGAGVAFLLSGNAIGAVVAFVVALFLYLGVSRLRLRGGDDG